MTTTACISDNEVSTEAEITFQKPRWTKCDKHTYNATINKKVFETNIDFETKSNTLLGLEIKKLETILQTATTDSIEGHKLLTTNKKTKGKGKWNKEIAIASKESKAIHREIKNSRVASKEQVHRQKDAKRKLRRLQRQEATKKRETLYKEIMTAEKEDQKFFYKLINKQRKNNQETAYLIHIEGKDLTTNDDIIDGWQIHFQKLATPQGTSWKRDHEELVNMN